MGTSDEYYRKLERIKLLEQQIELQQGLPFKYKRKRYKWQREFLESRNRNLFLCSANQVGKSTINWDRDLLWAFEPKLWPKLWTTRPWTFWYFYPSLPVATAEFEQKLVNEFLPRGKWEKHPQYGWRAEYSNKKISAIHCNTGVSIIFKSYGTDAQNLQTGTVWKISCDEEMPYNLYAEVTARRNATRGYFSMVFTATVGQQEWFETMEMIGQKGERFPNAHKIHATLYDSQEYEDGSPSRWTNERIIEVINECGSSDEVQRRVYGRFVKSTGRKYASFIKERNVKTPEPVPSDWVWYAGVDPGSSGVAGHPAAICFVAVHPNMQRGRVVRCWRASGDQNTTAADVYLKFKEMAGDRVFTGLFYDWAAKDFQVFADRDGVSFQKAEKSHEIGQNLLNSLFKNILLTIDDTPENQDLITELQNLDVTTKKQKAKDDAIDSMRYAVTRIPWDLSVITGKELVILPENRIYTNDELRAMEPESKESWGIEEEIAEWNDMLDP